MATLKELMAQKEALEQKIVEARETELADAIAKVLAIVSEYGLTAIDIFGKSGLKASGKKKAKIAAKYRDQNGNEWTGRGRTPKWIEGKDKSKFLIA
ncbi:MAG: H-NS histone family protein [Methylococcales bacterium]